MCAKYENHYRFNIQHTLEKGGGKEEKLYDHLMNTRSLTLTIDRYRSSWDLNITRKVKSDISKHWFECLNGNDNRVDYTNFIFAPN